MVGIVGHVRDLVLRQADQLRVAVDREIDVPQVEIDDLGEDTLVVADDDAFSRGVRLWSGACMPRVVKRRSRYLRNSAAAVWLGLLCAGQAVTAVWGRRAESGGN
jgi:hypothetical protein